MACSSKRVNNLGRKIFASFYLLLIAAVASVTGGVYEWVKNRPPTIGEAFPTGTMIVGVDATFPPFAVDNNGDLYGIDIDLGKMIAERLDIQARFVNMGFDGLYDALTDGQVDVVISALLVNASRTRDVRYTQPYFNNGLVLVNDSASNIVQMRDLSNHSLALEYGSIAHSEANFWSQRVNGFDLLPYELPQFALDAVRLDDADSALVDTTTYWLYRGQYPEWESEGHRVTNAFYAIAVRYDREATWIWVNETLDDISKDGTLQAILDRWFSA